jgi:hypothetical protein
MFPHLALVLVLVLLLIFLFVAGDIGGKLICGRVVGIK